MLLRMVMVTYPDNGCKLQHCPLGLILHGCKYTNRPAMSTKQLTQNKSHILSSFLLFNRRCSNRKNMAAQHIYFQRADLHPGTNQGFSDLIDLPDYANAIRFYIISQSTIFEVMFQRYSGNAQKKILLMTRFVLRALKLLIMT